MCKQTETEDQAEELVIVAGDYDSSLDAYYKVGTEFVYWKAHKIIDEFIEKITKKQKVEFRNFSLRQDHFLDNINMKNNRNGSCFATFKQLCQDKDWDFDKGLLLDFQRGLSKGTTMNNARRTFFYKRGSPRLGQN